MWMFTVPVCSQTSQAQQQLSWDHILNKRAHWAVENPPRNALPGTPYSQHSGPEATQALCLPGRRAEAAPAAAGAHRTPQAGRDLQGSNLAHLLWGSCSIPTCSTVRTATKRLKATQIQGTLAAAYGPQFQCSWLEQSQHKRGLPHHSWLCHWFTEVTGFSSAPLPCTFTWCYYITTSLGGARISQCLLAFSC